MAVWVGKNIIRVLLCEKMKQLKVPLSEPYRQLVLNLFNLFLGQHPLSTTFWTTTELMCDKDVHFNTATPQHSSRLGTDISVRS
jgi:hypothetical protein